MEAATISAAPATNSDAVNTRALGMWRWKTESSTTPTATPHAEREDEEAEPGRARAEHLVGEHGPERHEHAAADEPGGQARR